MLVNIPIVPVTVNGGTRSNSGGYIIIRFVCENINIGLEIALNSLEIELISF